MANKQLKAVRVKANVQEKVAKNKKHAAKKPTRAELYTKHFTPPGFVDETQFIQQVNGFGTPTFSLASSSAGV